MESWRGGSSVDEGFPQSNIGEDLNGTNEMDHPPVNNEGLEDWMLGDVSHLDGNS